MGRPKIGAVSYLNTRPLVAGLVESADIDLRFDLPSRLADQLARRELDVALIPVIEAVSNPEYRIVSDACIACRGPVWSVKLMSRVPGKEIKTLSLDEGSRTSSALVRILLDQKFGVRPECEMLPIDRDWKTVESDAALIIGDRAMKAEDSAFPVSWDLGQAWECWTDKPFVFAVWAAHPDSDLQQLDSILSKSRDRGVLELEKISREEAPGYRLTEEECLKYLRDNLHFQLGDAEKSAMELYFQYAAGLSLIPDSMQLQFHGCEIS
jgi:chorismate dehydratase